MEDIILATTSQTRITGFESLNIDFKAEGSNVYEYGSDRPKKPEELVRYLSKLKAEAVSKNHKQGIVIGFDSVGYFNNQILEKPKSREEAFRRLSSLSGNQFDFYTGIYITDFSTSQGISNIVKTKVKLRKIVEEEINKYLDEDDEFTKWSLGFNPWRSYASTFIEEIAGSYTN